MLFIGQYLFFVVVCCNVVIIISLYDYSISIIGYYSRQLLIGIVVDEKRYNTKKKKG